MATVLLERTHEPDLPAETPAAAPDSDAYGREQALDAMLYAARRMGIVATDRQVAMLLTVAERHLLVPETDEESFPHGTLRGYRRHRRRGEAACEACREACRLESAARRKRRRVQKPCGTEAAYHRHLRAWEEPCEPCRQAHRTYVREYRDRRSRAAAA
ncbi:hypothetical protein [Streptomyces sp. NPDC058084]|uniref:hypothetical protein n=1 Tax=Streptomyces sp. NPDC058084 TaxID=3346333 RepID=UPI0036E8753A